MGGSNSGQPTDPNTVGQPNVGGSNRGQPTDPKKARQQNVVESSSGISMNLNTVGQQNMGESSSGKTTDTNKGGRGNVISQLLKGKGNESNTTGGTTSGRWPAARMRRGKDSSGKDREDPSGR